MGLRTSESNRYNFIFMIGATVQSFLGFCLGLVTKLQFLQMKKLNIYVHDVQISKFSTQFK